MSLHSNVKIEKKLTYNTISKSFVECAHVEVESLVNNGSGLEIFRVKFGLVFSSVFVDEVSGSSTALFDGWRTGAIQVAEQMDPAQLNRVLLLSDGQANADLTDQAKVAEKGAGLTQRGVSTSAFGLGDGFDEDLMGSIAGAGDGTLAFIENSAQLAEAASLYVV